MPTPATKPTTGILLSGGIDSSILLAQLLDAGWNVVPIYVQTGCIWQSAERQAVQKFLARLRSPRLHELVLLDMPLADIYGDHWSLSGIGVPDDHSPDEAVFLPARNPLLLIKSTLWCQMHGVSQLALGTLAGNPFHDATREFFNHFEAMLTSALDSHVKVVRPLEHITKRQAMEHGRNLPLELTFSCLFPINGQHCGQCNKCAERRRAFQDIGLEDKTAYHHAPPQAPSTPA